MRVRKALVVVLCLLITVFSVGCRRRPPAPVAITDPVELERLWQEYFYPAIPTVGNTFSFAAAAEIDPVGVAEFCWFKYTDEHGRDGLPSAEPGNSQLLFPISNLLPYAERYFGLTSLNLAELEPYIYDAQRQAFLFGTELESPRPAYNAGSAWGQTLTHATKNGDGTVTVVLTDTDRISGRTVSTMTYTMKERDDGGLIFVAGKKEYIDNHLVSLTGDYQRFDGITGFDGSLSGLSLLGEIDGKMVLTYAVPGRPGESGTLMLVDPATMAVEKRFALDDVSFPIDAGLTAEGIVVRLADRLLIVNRGLTRSEETALPAIISDKSRGEWFRGYDASADRQTYVYADKSGVKFVDAAANSEKMLFASDPQRETLYSSPRFVADGSKVIATLCGYDGAIGYAIYDLPTGNSGTYMIAIGGTSTQFIRHDTGLLEVNTYLTGDGGLTGFYATVYLDFMTEEVRQVAVDDPGDTGDRGSYSQAYVGTNHAAFLTAKRDNRDNANSVFFINRLDLSDMAVDPSLITVKAAETEILGVLDDGRVVFTYWWNPSEYGICITK